MARTRISTLAITALLASSAGCVGASSKPCGNYVCPRGWTCHAIHGCVLPAQEIACAGRADGDPCELSGETGYHCEDEVCVLGRCGDGFVDPDSLEVCDDGPDNSDSRPDACRTNCQLPFCGDGVRDASEVCDDGNAIVGDGCSLACRSDESCGNGLVDSASETCDDGNRLSGDGCSSCCSVEAPTWTRWLPGEIGTRVDHAMAYDNARHKLVLWGGGSPSNLVTTFENDGSGWVAIPTVNAPGFRGQHAMAYDAGRGVVVLYGGGRGVLTLPGFDDTWEYDGTDWVERQPANNPGPRRLHEMVYFAAQGVTILFGGTDGTPQNETWAYDGSDWTQRFPAASPEPRVVFGMAYDPARQRIVVHGGGGIGTFNTWEYDGTTWTKTVPDGTTAPMTMLSHSVTYDASRQVVVAYGGALGTGASRVLSDRTFEYDGASWTERVLAPRPPARSRHAGGFLPGRGVVISGGDDDTAHLADTWTFDGTGWSEPPANPGLRHVVTSAFDRGRGRAVLFGGGLRPDAAVYEADTWEWGGETWRRRDVSGPQPPGRGDAAMAYDPLRDRIVMFGGYDGTTCWSAGCAGPHATAKDDTWEWDGDRWQLLTPATRPPARAGGRLAYHASLGGLVLFGGWGPGESLLSFPEDTWLWDGIAWREITPTGASPPGRRRPAMAHDPGRDRTVLWGGYDAAERDDTWEFDGQSWRLVDIAAGDRVPAREGQAMVYDEARRRLVLVRDDTLWEYHGAGWTRIVVAGAIPIFRAGMAYVYDTWRREHLLFGAEGASLLDSTWRLNYLGGCAPEDCTSGVDSDGDGLAGCDDPDCSWRIACTCGNSVCDDNETPASCPSDC